MKLGSARRASFREQRLVDPHTRSAPVACTATAPVLGDRRSGERCRISGAVYDSCVAPAPLVTPHPPPADAVSRRIELLNKLYRMPSVGRAAQGSAKTRKGMQPIAVNGDAVGEVQISQCRKHDVDRSQVCGQCPWPSLPARRVCMAVLASFIPAMVTVFPCRSYLVVTASRAATVDASQTCEPERSMTTLGGSPA
jgi:hypothetical protein